MNCGVYSKILKCANTPINKISSGLQTLSAEDVSRKKEFYAFVLTKTTSKGIALFLCPITFLHKRAMKDIIVIKNTNDFGRFVMLINHQNIQRIYESERFLDIHVVVLLRSKFNVKFVTKTLPFQLIRSGCTCFAH